MTPEEDNSFEIRNTIYITDNKIYKISQNDFRMMTNDFLTNPNETAYCIYRPDDSLNIEIEPANIRIATPLMVAYKCSNKENLIGDIHTHKMPQKLLSIQDSVTFGLNYQLEGRYLSGIFYNETDLQLYTIENRQIKNTNYEVVYR